MITAQTTLAELEQLAHEFRDRPDKPTPMQFKFFGPSRRWAVTLCMVGGPVKRCYGEDHERIVNGNQLLPG